MPSLRWILLGVALVLAGCQDHRAPVDSDGDGVPAGLDCDDSDPTLQALLTVYRDGDGDGVGSGPASALCTDGTVPAGFSLLGTDCAPLDRTAWRAVASLPVDRDGDGVTTREAVSLCLGDTLPAPYLAADQGNDCDDGDAGLTRWVVLYRDVDGDGHGSGPRWIACLGDALPDGWSRIGPDVDDLDPSVWADPEADGLLRLLLD